MITSIVSFCTHDHRFLDKCIDVLTRFSDRVLVVVADHFYDGREENYLLLEEIYRRFSHLDFIEFVYDEQELYGTCARLVPGTPDWAHHWHNTSRLVGFYHVPEQCEWILFCDVDEIFDAEKMQLWLEQGLCDRYQALRFACYWYFREAYFQATTWTEGPLLVKKAALSPDMLLDEDERMGLYFKIQGNKERLVLGADLTPLVHHYSWVRTKEELLLKTRSWGHHWERDWASLINEEFSRPFNGTDFVRHYKYITVESVFNPLNEAFFKCEQVISLSEHLKKLENQSNVKRVTARAIFRKGVEWMLR